MEYKNETTLELERPINKRRNFYLVTVTERSGEREYTSTFLMWCGVKADPWRKARSMCRGWYDGSADKDQRFGKDTFEFMFGSIVLDLDSVLEIPEAHFHFLNEHSYVSVL